MPDWIQKILLVLGSFVTGQISHNLNEARSRHTLQQETALRTAIAVEGLGSDLKSIRSEVHTQMLGLRGEIHEQVSKLSMDLHSFKEETARRIEGVEDRVTYTNQRIDEVGVRQSDDVRQSLASTKALNARLDMERGCWDHRPPGDK